MELRIALNLCDFCFSNKFIVKDDKNMDYLTLAFLKYIQ